MYIFQKQVTQS